jgi:dienelactone hydrolase
LEAANYRTKELVVARKARSFAKAIVVSALVPSPCWAEAPRASVEHLSFDTNAAANVKPATIKATLYLPPSALPAPAMVIISSSGGVIDSIEGYYARELSKAGIASLVVDSFGPRGVKNIIQDQSLVTSWDMENDAFAALIPLRKDKRIDASHIGIMGVPKGGIVAQNSAFTVRQKWRATGDLAFAAHVPIVPDCAVQHRNVTTTGKHIFYMLAELDDYNSAQFCREYADRIRIAGNKNVSVKTYMVHHNWEDTAPVHFQPKAENYSKCKAFYEDNGAMTMAVLNGPTLMKGSDIFEWRRSHCMTIGAHVGGGTETLKREATSDLVAFLKRAGF